MRTHLTNRMQYKSAYGKITCYLDNTSTMANVAILKSWEFVSSTPILYLRTFNSSSFATSKISNILSLIILNNILILLTISTVGYNCGYIITITTKLKALWLISLSTDTGENSNSRCSPYVSMSHTVIWEIYWWEINAKFQSENLRGRDYAADLIKLKWILKN